MLVLTRKHQEKIRIGDHIVITVLKTKGKTVRLGIEAPTEVPVIRGELSFESQAVEWRDESSADEPEVPRLPVTETSRMDRVRDHWPTKPELKGIVSRPVGKGPRVSLQRVSREQVTQILPNVLGDQTLGDAGPLRDMLNRRSVSA
jgi:carbon storage regulator CsrA